MAGDAASASLCASGALSLPSAWAPTAVHPLLSERHEIPNRDGSDWFTYIPGGAGALGIATRSQRLPFQLSSRGSAVSGAAKADGSNCPTARQSMVERHDTLLNELYFGSPVLAAFHRRPFQRSANGLGMPC